MNVGDYTIGQGRVSVLKPMTDHEYCVALCNYFIRYENGKSIFNGDAVLFHDQIPALHISPNFDSAVASLFDEALLITMQNISYLENNVTSHTDENFNPVDDDWNVGRMVTQFKSDYVDQDMEISNSDCDKIVQSSQINHLVGLQNMKRKSGLSSNVILEKRQKRDMSINEILVDSVSNGVISSDVVLLGVIEVIERRRLPFRLAPIHCRDKKTHLMDMLQKAEMVYGNMTVSRKIAAYTEIVRGDDNPLKHVKDVHIRFDVENNIIRNSEYFHRFHSIIYTLESETMKSAGSTGVKSIAPLYMTCRDRPVSDRVVCMRSFLLYLLSYFPKKIPDNISQQCKSITLDSDVVMSLIDREFMIALLKITLAHKSQDTTSVDIFRYYFQCLDVLTGHSPTIRSFTSSDLMYILTGKDQCDTIEALKDMSGIQSFLETNMIDLSTLLHYDKEDGCLRTQLVYKDNRQRIVRMGILCKSGKHRVIGRELKLGNEHTVTSNFVSTSTILNELNVKSDGKLIACLLVEGRDIVDTLHILISNLCKSEHRTPKILSILGIFKKNQIGVDLPLKILRVNSTDPGEVFKNVDILEICQDAILCALSRLHQDRTHAFLIGKTEINSSDVYILKGTDEYILFSISPKNDAVLDRCNQLLSSSRFDSVAEIIRWVMDTEIGEILTHILLQTHPTLSKFVKSVKDYITSTDRSTSTAILNITIDILESTQQHRIFGDQNNLQSLIDNLSVHITPNILNEPKNIPMIFKLTGDMGYLFTDRNHHSFLLVDQVNLKLFGGKLSELDVLQNIADTKWEQFGMYGILTQQLYWRYVVQFRSDDFKSYITCNEFNWSVLKSYKCQTIKILGFDTEKLRSIIKTLIETTPFGMCGDVSGIVVSEMSKHRDKIRTIHIDESVLYYVSMKDTKPVLVVLFNGTDGEMTDILLLQYMTRHEVGMGFAIIKECGSPYKIAMFVDSSSTTEEFFSLTTVDGVFSFMRKKFGNFLYTYESDDESGAMKAKCVLSSDANSALRHCQTPILEHLKVWYDKQLKFLINLDYDILPNLFRYAHHVFPYADEYKPYISFNHSPSCDNVLNYDIYKDMLKDRKNIGEKHSVLIFEKPEEVKQLLRQKNER